MAACCAPGARSETSPESLARLFDLSVEDVVGGRLSSEHFRRAIHPDDMRRLQAAMQPVLAAGGAFETEYRLRQGHGAIRWVAVRGRVDLAAGGAVRRVAGLAFDVTPQKDVERDAAVLVEIGERIRTIDDVDELCAAVGRVLDEALGGAHHVLLPGPGRHDGAAAGLTAGAARLRALDALLAGRPREDLRAGRTVAIADVARGLDPEGARGERAPIGALVAVPRSGEGRCTFTLVALSEEPRAWSGREVALLENVAERTWNAVEKLRLGARLRESEERYRSLVSATTAIVGVTDSEGRFVAPQPAWEAYTGQPWSEHGGYGYIDALHPDDREAAALAWERSRRARTMFQYEARLRHAASGSYRYCSARVIPVTNADGSIREWVSSISDVDEQRRAETASKRAAEEREDLLRVAEQARAEAERASRAKDDFLATLSHELRSPLQAAMGWATLLRSGSLSTDQQEKAIEIVERSIRHQVQLVDDLLDVSRILSGKLHLEISAVDLALVMEQLRDEMQVDARKKKLELVIATGDCGTVLGDAQRLAQIFRNLLANAIKFTPAGGSIAVTGARTGDGVVVTVADTGMGIAPEFLPRIFDRFSQADSSTTRQHGGLGLGLGIVQHLVGRHGGTVEVDSPGLGRGATFRVRLPAAPDSMWSQDPAVVGSEQVAGSLHGVVVGIVEDDAVAREALALLLEEAGARVVAAGGAREALGLFAGGRPHVIVSDLGMPNEDGFWLARELRRAGVAAPIIAVSGFADAEVKARALAAGFRAHIAKPAGRRELVDAIARLVASAA